MAAIRKVIVTAAVTGGIHTPSMSPHLPSTPDEIADSALGAAEAGASILHLHTRDPKDGRPSQAPEFFAPILEKLSGNTDAVLNLTTGGNPTMTVEERLRPVREFKPELASLNMGSMNFGLYPMLERFKEFKHEWEPQVLEATRDVVFRNTFKDIETVLEIGAANDTRFEFECYDISHLYNLQHMHARGLTRGRLFVQSVFGILGGIGGHPEDLMHMRRTADRLLGEDYEWSILGAGKNQMSLAMMGAQMGSHVRVGLEDSLWIGPKQLATSNAQQVEKIRASLEALGYEIATPDEAREMLGLKGRDKVGF